MLRCDFSFPSPFSPARPESRRERADRYRRLYPPLGRSVRKSVAGEIVREVLDTWKRPSISGIFHRSAKIARRCKVALEKLQSKVQICFPIPREFRQNISLGTAVGCRRVRRKDLCARILGQSRTRRRRKVWERAAIQISRYGRSRLLSQRLNGIDREA